jgi:hypothetical protein
VWYNHIGLRQATAEEKGGTLSLLDGPTRVHTDRLTWNGHHPSESYRTALSSSWHCDCFWSAFDRKLNSTLGSVLPTWLVYLSWQGQRTPQCAVVHLAHLRWRMHSNVAKLLYTLPFLLFKNILFFRSTAATLERLNGDGSSTVVAKSHNLSFNFRVCRTFSIGPPTEGHRRSLPSIRLIWWCPAAQLANHPRTSQYSQESTNSRHSPTRNRYERIVETSGTPKRCHRKDKCRKNTTLLPDSLTMKGTKKTTQNLGWLSLRAAGEASQATSIL